LWRSLADVVPQQCQHIDDLCEEMRRALERKFQETRRALEGHCDHLEALNPLAILRRGYSVTMSQDGRTAVRDVAQLKKGDRLKTRLARGEFISCVEKISPG
jgi:exodeoxyribonuclease VII large subunit